MRDLTNKQRCRSLLVIMTYSHLKYTMVVTLKLVNVFQWVSLISPQVRLHLLYLIDLRKIINNLGSDPCAASFVDVDVQFEGFNVDDECEG
ncbi:hypothetical protein ACFX15_003303 [Malus domestica]